MTSLRVTLFSEATQSSQETFSRHAAHLGLRCLYPRSPGPPPFRMS